MSRPFAALLTAALLSAPTFADDPPKAAPPKPDEPKPAAPEVNVSQMSTTQAINHYIAQGYEKAGIKKPTARATDAEFLRRAFLDLVGRIATVEEVLDFEQDRSADKRKRLVKRLLYGVQKYENGQPARDKDGKPVFGPYKPAGQAVKADGKEVSFDYADEFADHWANLWTVLLMSRTTHPVYREQMHAWLWDKFYANRPWDEVVREVLTATGTSNRNQAVNFIVAHLGDSVPAADRAALGHHDAVPLTARVTRLFLGLQTQCSQCHPHPFNKEWEQPDFWGVNAFFRQTRRSATPTPRNPANNQMMTIQDKIELTDDPTVNPTGVIQYEKRDGTSGSVRPLFLKDYAAAMEGQKSVKRLPANVGASDGPKSRRAVLADYLIAHDNFAKAYVNRVWGHFFGRGLNKEPSVDDFGSNNEVIHPELLDRLAADFKQYGYDTKQLVEAICTSDVYGLSHVAVKEYADPKFDAFFARMPLKAMSPEVLFESLSVATKSEAAAGDKDARKRLRDAWMSKLVSNFGDDEGNELTFNGTVIQALLMMNGRELNEEVLRRGNVVEAIMRKHARGGAVSSTAVIDELFLTALNRHPTPAEVTALKDIQDGTVVASRDDKKPDDKAAKPGDKKPPVKSGPTVVAGTGSNDMRFYQDVFWALLNTTEFMLNH
jgi:hypothetical protein